MTLPSLNRAVSLDRDGTLIEDKGYAHRIEDVVLLPGVVEGLRRLVDAGYALIIVTNQSGIGRGYYKESHMTALHRYLVKKLEAEHIPIAAIYHCPHAPEEGCDCRKPGIELFERAARELGIVLKQSWMIGDSCSDIEAARRATIRSVKLGGPVPDCTPNVPDFYAPDFAQAVAFIAPYGSIDT